MLLSEREATRKEEEAKGTRKALSRIMIRLAFSVAVVARCCEIHTANRLSAKSFTGSASAFYAKSRMPKPKKQKSSKV